MNTQNPKWTGLAINGAVAIAIGTIFIFMPKELITSIVKILGVVMGLAGIAMLFFTFFKQESKGALSTYYLIQGVVNLALGSIMFINPLLMIDFIMFVIGVWAIAIGIFQIIYALKVRNIVNSGLFLLGNGIVFAGLGLIMILSPETVMNTMLAIIGIIIGLLGVILLYFSYLVHKQNKLNHNISIQDAEIITEEA